MTVFLLYSGDRFYGGKVIHGIFSTWEKAEEEGKNIGKDYYRVWQINELEVDKVINVKD